MKIVEQIRKYIKKKSAPGWSIYIVSNMFEVGCDTAIHGSSLVCLINQNIMVSKRNIKSLYINKQTCTVGQGVHRRRHEPRRRSVAITQS